MDKYDSKDIKAALKLLDEHLVRLRSKGKPTRAEIAAATATAKRLSLALVRMRRAEGKEKIHENLKEFRKRAG